MPDPTPLFRRCGLDLEHEQHHLPDGALCDGHVETPTDPGAGLAGLFALSEAPRPWLPGALPDELRDDLAVQIGRFTDWLNHVYAVAEAELIPACWPLHPGLVHDLAALWAFWVEANQALGATPDKALDFHERRLPAFYTRLPRHLGRGNDVCSPAGHRDRWRSAEQRWEQLYEQALEREDPRSSVRRTAPAPLLRGD